MCLCILVCLYRSLCVCVCVCVCVFAYTYVCSSAVCTTLSILPIMVASLTTLLVEQ